jgi:peptidyl-prolyl cis-trans isomerase D
MLKQLRSRKVVKRIMLWTIILVIPSFITFYGWQRSAGRGGAGEYGRESVALVKDAWWGLRWRAISPAEQELAHDEVIQRYLRLFQSQGLRVAREDVRNLVGPREIADEAIDSYYLEQLARRNGLSVTRDERRNIIAQTFPGQSPETILRILAQQQMTVNQLDNEITYRATLNKAQSYIYSFAKASLFELWQEYLIGQEKIQIQYARVLPQEFRSKVNPTTDTLRGYFEAHSADYRVPDRAEFRYVAILRSDVEKDVQPTSEALTAFYEKHKKDLFSQKPSTEASQILITAATDAPTSVVQAALTKIRDVAAKIKAGAKFADMANTYSEDPANTPDPKAPTKKLGGKVALPISAEAPCPYGDEFKRLALALAVDQVSSPVRSPMGFHLIKADTVTTSGILPFKEVEQQAREQVHSELTDVEFKKRGQDLRTLLTEKSFSTLDSFATEAKLPICETGMVDMARPDLPKIGSISDDLELIKEMREGEYSEGVFRNPGAYFVLELKRKQPAHVPPFEQVAQDVREDYITSGSAALAKRQAEEMVRQSKTLDDLRKQAEKQGLKLEQTNLFTREQADDVLPNLDPLFKQATLRFKVDTIHMTVQGSDPKHPVAYVVWFFEKQEEPKMDQFRKDLPQIRAEYLIQVQQALVEEWLYDQRHRIPAKINPVFEPKEEKEEQEKGG